MPFEASSPETFQSCRLGDAPRGELVLLALEDITERRDLARHQELLVGELSHRIKNTLAVVQSARDYAARLPRNG
jgi:hypothetical protein